MSIFCCENRNNCLTAAIVASVIVGIATAFLSFTATITVTTAFLWVVLGVAIGFLGLALTSAALIQGTVPCKCFCTTLSAFLLATLGTVLFALILLAVTFSATSAIGAAVTGILLFFFTLILTTAACLVKCIVNCRN